MRSYFIWCRIKHDPFIFYWKPGKDNYGYYPTKNHSPNHRVIVLPVYLHDPKGLTGKLQGCFNSAISARTVFMLLLPFGDITVTS